MKYAVLVSLCSLFLVGQPVIASNAAQCFETARAHTADGGLGLTIGQANELCRGSADGSNVIRCYSKAWGHPEKGGPESVSVARSGKPHRSVEISTSHDYVEISSASWC